MQRHPGRPSGTKIVKVEHRSKMTAMMRCAAIVIAAVVGCLLSGCGDVAPFASAEFALDKRAARLSIPLEVRPGGRLNIRDTYVLAAGVDAATGKEAIGQLFGATPTRSVVRLRVNLVRTNGGWDEHVAFAAVALAGPTGIDSTDYRYEGAADQSVVALVRQRGIGRTEASMEIASFRFPSFGTYRLDIETIEDQPVLRGVKTTVYVSVPFGHPK